MCVCVCHKWNVCELHSASYKSRRQAGGGGGRGEGGSLFEGAIGGAAR